MTRSLSPKETVPSSAPPPTHRRTAYVRLAALVVVLALAAWGAYRLGLFELGDAGRLAVAIARVREVPALPFLFVLGYALAAGVGLPATAFTLAGGALFGTLLGSVLNWTGAVLGALAAHALARQLGSGAVRNLLGRHAGKLDYLSGRTGFATLLRLRLVPVVPFNALNFAAGLAPVPFRAYALATAIGIVPGTVIYTYFADSLVAGVTGARNRALLHVAIAGALLIAISFGPALVRRVRRSGATVVMFVGASLSLAATGRTQEARVDHGAFCTGSATRSIDAVQLRELAGTPRACRRRTDDVAKEGTMARAMWNDVVIAESEDVLVVDGFTYFPRDAVHSEYLEPSEHTSHCSWKGEARYYTLRVKGARNPDAAWYYPAPKPEASRVRDHIGFWRGVEVRP